MITSTSNPRVKEAVKLRESRGRRKQGRIVIDGLREIERAVAGGVVPIELFHAPQLHEQGQHPQQIAALLARLGEERVTLLEVSRAVFQKLAFGDRAEGILAIAATPQRALATLDLPAGSLIAVLEGIEKPGNVGAVLRSADGAGINGVIVADPVTDLFNPNAIRSSLGAIFTLPIAVATSHETLAWLAARDCRIFATRVEQATPYTEASYRGEAAIVLGSEAVGLTEVWRGPQVTEITLPMQGVADSLNVSNTAAVLFYEALRQRMG